MPQTWLIVGATRGIGLEFTSQLLSLGHTVIATARSPTHSLLTPSPSLPLPLPNQTPNPDPHSPRTPKFPSNASNLWALTGTPNGHNLTILECDVSDEKSIKSFTESVRKLGRKGGVLEGGVIDVVVLNAGVLEYPGRVSEISFTSFAHHLHTNTIGPLITASHLLSLSSPLLPPSSSSSTSSSTQPTTPLSPLQPTIPIQIKTMVFTSSDSGSTTNFRSFEDGFGAYAASKAALNQGLRHLAAEIHRKSRSKAPSTSASISNLITNPNLQPNSAESGNDKTVVLALHPGEVSTDMANVALDWEVEGIISPQESISCMLKVIREKGYGGQDEGGVVSARSEGKREEEGAATFWTWEGKRYPW
ncbi:short-chain dehydrogenase [Cadophora sp. MPI-SDFR-AT-0126]|nr:short-chain dehydrogenase [Leotiomycetes sp. MPI-SDFR-AT-0126]